MKVLKFLKKVGFSFPVAYPAVVLFVIAFSFALFSNKSPVYREVNLQRKATHLIQFVHVDEQSGEQKILQSCTATAVGDQALLTAEHCTEGAEPTIKIDLSPVIYTVDAGVSDGRDHVILHIKGAHFKNVVNVVERPARMGERLHMYGNGGNDYPSHALHGTVISDDYEGDLSDIDNTVDTACYSLHVIGGDSGSAVYGDDGDIVGLISYGRGEHDEPYDFSTGFALNFSPEVIEMVKH